MYHSTVNTKHSICNTRYNNKYSTFTKPHSNTKHPTLNTPNPEGECGIFPVLGPSQPLQHCHGYFWGTPQHWRGIFLDILIKLTEIFFLTFLLFQNQMSMLLTFASCHIFAMSSVCSNPVMWDTHLVLAWSPLFHFIFGHTAWSFFFYIYIKYLRI